MEGLKNIVRQVLIAVSYVHAIGFVHTGTSVAFSTRADCETFPDIKSDNIIIDDDVQNEAIAKYLAEHPSQTYPARHEHAVSPDPIITVVSEPLPPFNLPNRDRLRLKLGDFGAGAFSVTVDDHLELINPIPSFKQLYRWTKQRSFRR